jgi:hypothetical protein
MGRRTHLLSFRLEKVDLATETGGCVMNRAIGVLALASILGGCATTQTYSDRTLTVRWQRLVNDVGGTCQRCATTQHEVRLAADTLERSLRPLNMKVLVEERPMTPEEFAKDFSQSNRILVDGRSLADWLGGTIGMSPCESCCPKLGPKVKCRTLTVDGQVHEAISASLIVRAGLRAAESALAKQPVTRPCCPK